jgi:hypothetical protein
LRAHTIRAMPPSWTISLIVLVVCLLASMVIALVKLI